MAEGIGAPPSRPLRRYEAAAGVLRGRPDLSRAGAPVGVDGRAVSSDRNRTRGNASRRTGVTAGGWPHRAGELVVDPGAQGGRGGGAGSVPARADLVDDRDRARKRLLGLAAAPLVGVPGRQPLDPQHQRWLAAQRFDEPALAADLATPRQRPSSPRTTVGQRSVRPE